MLKIGTVLFTYHRSEHTRKVVEALSDNEVLPEKLYIFQDGKKEGTNIDGWKRVNELIHNISWCKTEVHVSANNKGIAKSVVEGVNYVLQECDAVIVLEDDCVPHKQFMRFMTSALNTYQNVEKIYCVSGYAWNIDLPKQVGDVYFNGRNCSYGWGTWQDRWNQYEEDYHIITKIEKDREAYERLQVWGRDLAEMVVGNVLGQCDAWDVFWGLKIIQKGGYCVSPYRQMIDNIGFDGSGVHCGIMQQDRSRWESELKKEFLFPKEIAITEECEEEFRFLFPGRSAGEKLRLYQNILLKWIQCRQKGENIKLLDKFGYKIAVWGRGRICDCLLSEIQLQASIQYIIESRPSTNEYKGYPVISVNDLPQDVKDIVVIPYFDIDIIRAKVNRLRPDVRLWGLNELFE